MSLVFNRCEVVYFAVTPVGDDRHEHILQLAAKFERGETFSRWITLPTSAARYASKIEGLKVKNGRILVRNQDPDFVPLAVVLRMFIEFLESSMKPVVLVTYHQASAIPLLLRAILAADLVDACHGVIKGYHDSDMPFIKMLPDRKKRVQFALPILAKDILKEEYTRNNFDLLNRLQVLEKLVMHLGLRNEIIKNCEPFQKALLSEIEAQYSPQIVRSLVPLQSVLSMGMMKKIAEAGVSYSTLERVFQEEGSEGLENFLSEKQSKKKLGSTGSIEIQQKIIKFFEAGTTSKHNNTGGNQTIHSRVNRLENQQDRIDLENDVMMRKRGQAHYQAPDRENSLYGEIGHIEDSQLSGAHSNPLKTQRDRIDRENDVIKRDQTQAHYPATERENSFYGPIGRIEDSQLSGAHSNPFKEQQDRIDREYDVIKRERGQAHYPATERENTLYGPIGHIKGSQLSGAHSNPLKKQQDQINREISFLRGKQEQSYEEVDLLRKRSDATEPVYDVLRRSYTDEQDQVDDGTVTLRRKHHPGNYNSGPSSSKRHAMYEKSPN